MLEIHQLEKRYGNTVVVDGISLSVAKGEVLVLLGGSGSGKTTTLKMINRLIEPTSGSVYIEGEDTASMRPHELRRRVGYVFQKIGLFPHMNIAENIAVIPSLLGWPARQIFERVEELLTLVGLDPAMKSRAPSELSGGQQQRVGVARALAARPNLMLLDEPFGSLDPLTRDHLQRSFLQLKRSLGLTAIFVTHDMVEALLIGDRIAVMHNGRLKQVGTPEKLLHAPADDYVERLMSTPKNQAELVTALLARSTRE